MKILDECKIYVKGGNGGNGCVSFRREKYVPRGGPDGGDGGKGGDIIIRSSIQKRTLIDFHYQRHYKAKNGKHGMGKNKKGKDGEDLVILVPCGTLVKDEEGNILSDLVNDGDEVIITKGGRGGRGNQWFATPTNQTPTNAEKGEKGEEKTIYLELKLIADIGIIGLPNAGKSTLINKISACKAKVADYSFTTITPNLGVVSLNGDRTFTVADCPGLIEGASSGFGLGFKFLRHIERTKILLHLIDISNSDDPFIDFQKIENELKIYSNEVYSKKRIIVLNKIDLMRDRKILQKFEDKFIPSGFPIFSISALTGEGIKELLERVWQDLITTH